MANEYGVDRKRDRTKRKGQIVHRTIAVSSGFIFLFYEEIDASFYTSGTGKTFFGPIWTLFGGKRTSIIRLAQSS